MVPQAQGPFKLPLEAILDDIQRAFNAGAYYAALSAAVTLPEICGRCEQQDPFATKGAGHNQRNVIKLFHERYLKDWPFLLNGDDLCNIRCGLSHRGQTMRHGSDFRVVFRLPDRRHGVATNNRRIGDDGQIQRIDVDLTLFIKAITDAVRAWDAANLGNEIVKRNLQYVIQPRPGDFGTGVFIDGQMVLA
jgi:hypothetical protein